MKCSSVFVFTDTTSGLHYNLKSELYCRPVCFLLRVSDPCPVNALSKYPLALH